eukprot:1965052-Rhodomonas_salina.1
MCADESSPVRAIFRGRMAKAWTEVNVQYSALATLPRIVALDVLEMGWSSGPFRRLLGYGTDTAERLLAAPWDDVSGVCKALVQQWNDEAAALPQLDHERLEECLKWHSIGQETLTRHNMTWWGTISSSRSPTSPVKFTSLTPLPTYSDTRRGCWTACCTPLPHGRCWRLCRCSSAGRLPTTWSGVPPACSGWSS